MYLCWFPQQQTARWDYLCESFIGRDAWERALSGERPWWEGFGGGWEGRLGVIQVRSSQKRAVGMKKVLEEGSDGSTVLGKFDKASESS